MYLRKHDKPTSKKRRIPWQGEQRSWEESVLIYHLHEKEINAYYKALNPNSKGTLSLWPQ
jgi:hypothetical protein